MIPSAEPGLPTPEEYSKMYASMMRGKAMVDSVRSQQAQSRQGSDPHDTLDKEIAEADQYFKI